MLFNPTKLKGAFTIDVQPFRDNRGFFTRFFCEKEFGAQNLVQHFVQANHSGACKKGIIRGMHFQRAPYCEVKLVKCVKGAIFDVIIDVRKDSPTFLQWFGTKLSEENKRMMYIPEGFAHGFQTLSTNAELIYLHSEFYNPDAESGIRFNDPAIHIEWPLEVTEISERDKNHPLIDSTFKAL